MTELTWQKSSFSSGDGNTTCIEVAKGNGRIHLRESEDPASVLTLDPRALRALLGHLREGASGIR